MTLPPPHPSCSPTVAACAELGQTGGAADTQRRRVLGGLTAAGLGYALSVQPVSAQTVSTPLEGLTAGWVQVPTAGQEMQVYAARPAHAQGRLPVVLVVSEIFGVHEHIADVARRFAHQGYLALAPELLSRWGDAKAYTDFRKLIAEVVSKATDATVMADLDACVNWALGQGGDVGRLGVTGFCWGGRITWMYAAHNPSVRAGVAWYGRLVGATTAQTPRHPVDVAGELKAPVLGLYGGADEGIPQATVQAMKVALAQGPEAARRSEFHVYPEGPHAFHADYRPSYRREMAEDGWKRCLDWLGRHGAGVARSAPSA
jgi:carboxymethylenebutenolidase